MDTDGSDYHSILEELVGEIWDEHEQEEMPIRKVAEHTYLVDAGMDFDDFADFFSPKTDSESEMVSVSSCAMARRRTARGQGRAFHE